MATASSDRRVALVSGGSRGLGRAISLALTRRGVTVVLMHSPGGAESARATLDELRRIDPRADAVPADVADPDQVAGAFAEVERRHGGIDVVVNGAGFAVLAPVVDLDLDELDRMHRTLVRGVFVMCRQAARSVRVGGSIINISSAAVRMRVPGSSAFVAAKAAVESVTGILADELRARDISVNAVAAGLTNAESALAERLQAERGAPVAGVLDADSDVAEIVAFLAGPRGHWMSGHVLPASSGRA